ncbi:hypothetical protein BH09BAC5_BH09BAC5_19950 [soil metagenome]
MENHENSGHDDHNTEGNRQSYPKGWWMPLIGLLIVALGFSAIGTVIFSVSGTDRWGKTEQCDEKCETNGKCCDDEKNCPEGKACKDEKQEAVSAPATNVKDSSSSKPAIVNGEKSGENK